MDLTSFPYFRVQNNYIQKNEKFQLFPSKCPWNQNWPYCKINQGQLTKGHDLYKFCSWYIPSFKAIGPVVSERKIFLKFWAFLSMAAILGHKTRIIYINFRSPLPKEATHKIWLWLVKRFRGEDIWKMWTDDEDWRQQTPDHGYTVRSPCEPEGR